MHVSYWMLLVIFMIVMSIMIHIMICNDNNFDNKILVIMIMILLMIPRKVLLFNDSDND